MPTLPITVPNVFANATGSIPLSQLDADFATVVAALNGIGSGATALANVSITGGAATLATLSATTVTASGTVTGGGFTTAGNVTVSGSTTTAAFTATGSANFTGATVTGLSVSVAAISGINSGPIAGLRNRIINGDMRVDQRNSGGASTTSTSAWTYTVDRWYASSSGATVSGQRVAGSSGSQYRYQFTGAASVTGITFGQRIEATNVYDLAGGTVSLGVDLANSLLTTVTWTVYYPNSADSYGTFGSPTRTQIATGTFTVTSTVSRYSTQITLPANATNGVEVVFSVGAQVSGTFTVGNVQFEGGGTASIFERRPVGLETSLCQRYYCQMTLDIQSPAVGSSLYRYTFPQPMRATPTQANITAGSAVNATVSADAGGATAAGAYFQVSASVAGGYVLGRVNTYSAEL